MQLRGLYSPCVETRWSTSRGESSSPFGGGRGGVGGGPITAQMGERTSVSVRLIHAVAASLPKIPFSRRTRAEGDVQIRRVYIYINIAPAKQAGSTEETF